MGFFRHQNSTTITVDRKIEDVFQALVDAGSVIGKVKEQSKLAWYVVIRTSMKLFPPRNSATVRVSLKKVDGSQTEISFSSDSADGVVGFGSAGKAIDAIIGELEKEL